ncbi:MAG: hypothetical protein ABIU54_08200 [Candidatus Eisenbacteria bacterium]
MSERPLPHRARVTAAWVFPALVVLLMALRFVHLGGPVDDPNSLRQCNTVSGSREFARHGIDLLHPSVSWLGSYRHMIFEFPLPQALAAFLHRAFGFDPLWDRVVALTFFTLSLYWLHRLVRELADESTARFTTFAYLLLPLGQYYSRAATIDFAAQAFAIGFLYHGLLAMRGRALTHVAIAAACGVLTSWIKVPYLVPVMFPFLLSLLTSRRAAVWMRAGLVLSATSLGFAWWRLQMNAVNAAAPDWNWMPGFYKEIDPWWYYARQFPHLVERNDLMRLGRRLVVHVFTAPGLILTSFTLGWRGPEYSPGSASTPGVHQHAPGPVVQAWVWMAGFGFFTLLYLPIEIGLEYTEVPVLAPAALLIALGGSSILQWARTRRMLPWVGAAMLAFPLIAITTPMRLNWYRVDTLRIRAGSAIQHRVPATELVVVVDHSSDFSDPRLLSRADRMGFALKAEHLTPALLARLQGVGARWVAWISQPGVARLTPPAFLDSLQVGEERILENGRELGTLHLYWLGERVVPSDSYATHSGDRARP